MGQHAVSLAEQLDLLDLLQRIERRTQPCLNSIIPCLRETAHPRRQRQRHNEADYVFQISQ